MNLMKYFDEQAVNTGRQPEMDIFKTLCIIGMIVSHVILDVVILEGTANVIFGDYVVVIVGAASFMICMGIGMRYSRNQTPAKYAARGIGLLTVGQFLNLLRNVLPNLIAYWITGKQFFIANSLLVFQADILSFAGIAFLLMALLKKIKMSDGQILALGFAMNILCIFCYHTVTPPSSFLLSQALGYIMVTDAECYFPLLSYFVFVAFGYYIGGYYPRIKDKDRLSSLILLICVPLCTVYYVVRALVPFPYLPEFTTDLQYIMVPGPDAVAGCLITLLILALLYKISKRFHGELPGYLTHPSIHINGYYCVSYLFILPMQTLLIAVKGDLLEGFWPGLIYSALVIWMCYLIIEWNDRHLHFDVAKLRGRKQIIFFLAVWVLSIATVIYAYPRIDEFATIWNDYLLP